MGVHLIAENMAVLFPKRNPGCLGLSFLMFLYTVASVSGQTTVITGSQCPSPKDLSEETLSESLSCCASLHCPLGFYSDDGANITCSGNTTVISNDSKNATNNGTAGDNIARKCSACHESCSEGTGCDGPKPQDCQSCTGEACNSTASPPPDGSTSLPIPIIAGSAAGGGVFLIIVVVVVCLVCRKCRHSSGKSNDVSKLQLDQELGAIDSEEPVHGEESDANKPALTGKLSQDEISQGHDRVLRYTPDPTQSGPQKTPYVEERQSGLYENQRSVEFVKQLSLNQEENEKKVRKVKKTGISDRNADAGSDSVIYENVNQKSENYEIAALPVAPAPPGAGLSGLSRGPAYHPETEAIDEAPEPSLPSSYSKTRLVKDPQNEPSNAPSSPALPVSKKKQSKWKLGKGVTSKNQPGTVSIQPGLMKGPAYKTEDGPSDTGPQIDTPHPVLMRGPAYQNSAEDEDHIGKQGTDKQDQTFELMKGPMYQKGEEHYKDKHGGNTFKALPSKSGLMKGPGYSAEEHVEKPVKRCVTKPKTGHVKGMIAALGVSNMSNVDDSDLGPEDYEPVCPPSDSEPHYMNFGFNS